jgi:hypothetical protein
VACLSWPANYNGCAVVKQQVKDGLGDVFVSEGTESLERCSPEAGRDKKLNSVERLIYSLVQHSRSFELLEQRESVQNRSAH